MKKIIISTLLTLLFWACKEKSKIKNDIINVEYDSSSGQGKDSVSKPVILYMPHGSEELKVW